MLKIWDEILVKVKVTDQIGELFTASHGDSTLLIDSKTEIVPLKEITEVKSHELASALGLSYMSINRWDKKWYIKSIFEKENGKKPGSWYQKKYNIEDVLKFLKKEKIYKKYYSSFKYYLERVDIRLTHSLVMAEKVEKPIEDEKAS